MWAEPLLLTVRGDQRGVDVDDHRSPGGRRRALDWTASAPVRLRRTKCGSRRSSTPTSDTAVAVPWWNGRTLRSGSGHAESQYDFLTEDRG